MSGEGPAIVVSLREYGYLGEAIAAGLGAPVSAVERKTFPDGEHYRRFEGDLTGRHVVLVGGTHSDEATLELYDLAGAAVAHGAGRLSLVVPYFGHSTMERAVRPGEVVTAKARARLLSSLPRPPHGLRVLLFDLHSEGIPYYFERGVTTCHVYGKPLVAAAARRFSGGDDFVLASTDAGRAKWVESLASDLGVRAAFVYKRRLDGERTEITGVSADVGGRKVVVYDDMIRTGGSLLAAALAYRRAGASDLYAVCTHGLFPGRALDRLVESGVFSGLASTDSHPRARELAGPHLAVSSCAGLFLPYLGASSP
ncbi:MAG TPA: ribose-phosphate diphosphokinase [Polyangiaceae bacterium]|nr:ribose-phosphate diphosphokinase [Polyangiaceae bacterium]